MKDKVIALLAKYGHSESSIEQMVSENFEMAVKCMPEAKAAKIAEFILCVS